MKEYRRITVDGQPFIVPDMQEWNGLLEKGEYDGLPIYSEATEGTVRELVSFVSRFPDQFCLGLFRAAYIKKSWLEMPFVDLNGRWQRVMIEPVKCASCGLSSSIANPQEVSLYFGLPEYLNVFRNATSLRRVNCPACNSSVDGKV